MPRRRLDQLCVERGLAESRQRAQALIIAGKVLVDDRPVTKAGTPIDETAQLRLRGAPLRFVSRGGDKLDALLAATDLDVANQVALDVGASTGGFTDCLLSRGAAHVIAVDVGYGQLAWALRQDPRVTCLERVNARHLTRETLHGLLVERGAGEHWPPTLAAVDVSFISLALVLPAITALLGPRRPIAALVKPQFEAGRADVGKGGVVKGEARDRAIGKVLDWVKGKGYTVIHRMDCPIHGPRGNVEVLLLLDTPEHALEGE